MEQQAKKRVLVIGGGLSGLSTADAILTDCPGSEVTVVEAMDRVGGRTLSMDIDGAHYDMGGAWIGPKQQYAKELAMRSNNQFVPQYWEGKKIMQFGKKIETYSSDIPTNVGILGLIQLQFTILKLDRMARKVPINDPSTCEHAIQWDSQTVATWIKSNIWTERVRILIEAAVRGVIGADTNEISLLFFLWYINQSYGVENLVNIKNGNQQKKLKLGAQHLSTYLQEQIQKKGGKVLLGRFVDHVDQVDSHCTIYTKQGDKFQVDYVVVALPPCNLRKIQFTPELSADKRTLCKKNFMGTITKVLLLYERPFWRQNGFSGETISDCFDSPIYNAYDDCRPKQNGQMQYGIVVFINANVAREWAKRADAQITIIERLSDYFKSKQMLNPIRVEWKNWQDQSSIDGAPVAYFPPGVLTQIKSLRGPEGRIHWAGTQMATVSQGFMDGAIESGKRAAKEVVQRFKDHLNVPLAVQKIESRNNSGFFYNKIVKTTKRYFEWI